MAPPRVVVSRRAALVAASSVACWPLVSGCGVGVPSANVPLLNQVVPMKLANIDGSAATLPPPGVRSVVFHFWAPECAPCKRLIPAVLGRKAEMTAKGAAHVLVCVLDAEVATPQTEPPSALGAPDRLPASSAPNPPVEGAAPNDVENAKATLALWGVQEDFLVDRGAAFLHTLGAAAPPAFAVVDSGGVLVWVAPDGVTLSNLISAIPG